MAEVLRILGLACVATGATATVTAVAALVFVVPHLHAPHGSLPRFVIALLTDPTVVLPSGHGARRLFVRAFATAIGAWLAGCVVLVVIGSL